MGLTAEQLQFMMDRGLTIADAVEFARLGAPAPTLSPGAVRTRRWRERQEKAETVTEPVTVTHHGDVSHVGERAQVVITTSSSLQSEEVITPVTPNGVTAPRGADKARGTRLPDGWMPEGSDWELALDLCNGDAGAVDELDRFLDYWRAVPGAKGRKADWPATWRNWVRRASQTPSRKANDRPHNDAKLAAKNANYARAWTGSERASGRDWEP